MKFAILITVFNRKEKTLKCLDSVMDSLMLATIKPDISVFLTDDGSTDGTSMAIREKMYPFPINILQGDGSLYWNGGMIKSWKAAIDSGEEFDGFLWLNNDTEILPGFWDELQEADKYCHSKYGKGGIYVGSTYGNDNANLNPNPDLNENVTLRYENQNVNANPNLNEDVTLRYENQNVNANPNLNENERHLTYGGFNFVSKITLKDEFVVPNGDFQECQCAHGNLTYISNDVVEELGIFTDEYIHSGGDHDYTYRAYKKGFHLIVLPSYVGICENDHPKDGYDAFLKMTLKERIASLRSPIGFNMHNTLVFQRRCFPYRYPFVWLTCWLKILFPRFYWKTYQWLRK